MKTIFPLLLLIVIVSACTGSPSEPLKEVSADQVELMIKRLDMRIANTEKIFVPFMENLATDYTYSTREPAQRAIEKELNLLGKIIDFEEGYIPNDCSDVKSTANAVVKRFQLFVGIDLHDLENSAAIPGSERFNALFKEKMAGIQEIHTQYKEERAALLKSYGLTP